MKLKGTRKAYKRATEEEKEVVRKILLVLNRLSYYGYELLKQQLKEQNRKTKDYLIEVIHNQGIKNLSELNERWKNMTQEEYVFAIFLKEINKYKLRRYPFLGRRKND